VRAAAVALVALVATLSLGLAACGDNLRGRISIAADPAFEPAIVELVRFIPYHGLSVSMGTRAAAEAPENAIRIDVILDAAIPAEGYRLEASGGGGDGDGDSIEVRASDVLGAQYGTAAALEALGFRFRHPFDTFVPDLPVLGEAGEPFGVVHQPEVRVRGMQLHTLHPIEGYFAFWEPSAGSRNDAQRIIDWLIKNRGNFLQWVALDDILDPMRRMPWQEHTRELIDYAHARGVRTGLNIQLFGQSNLQLAFDLSDDKTGTIPIADEIAARLPLVTDGVPFDVYDLSFGEFFNADPQRFVDSVNEVRRQLRGLAPQAEMHAVVHVGETQRVSYQGEELLYYFLVKFADPSIVPDIHTVMFFNLFEPAGGAYHHEDFDEHLAYLSQRICANQPAAYFPETAYWIAFDNSIPQLLPLYVRNRWLDLAELRARVRCGKLDNHLLFSSGWDWGYWLHDVTALRASYELPGAYEDLVRAELQPELGAAAPSVIALIELQRTYLMERRLIAYLAGREASIDAGRLLGIVSQPDRITIDDLATGAADPQAFRAAVQAPLAEYAGELDGLAEGINRLSLPDNPWAAELRDGFAVNRLRARFVLEIYEATLGHLAGEAAAARDHVTRAAELLERARGVVAARHRDLHDTHARRLVERTTNRTFYQYGYLFMADTLCFWKRELAQLQAILGTATAPPPGCLL
jgi:hypothetical protein